MVDKKKAGKASKSLDKKSMKKTKGGIIAVMPVGGVQQGFHFNPALGQKVTPGQINGCDGSV